MYKKGVSPLIATVLLIAFVVAIGAVVMNWGTGYIKSEQEKATSTSDVRLTCATNVNLKLMKVSNLKDYCYDNSTGSVTISARLSKGEKDLKGIRVNVISNSISETKDYSREISNLNFQINLGNFSNDLINNNGLIEYVELVPYIDNNGEDYFCSGASLELSDFSLCEIQISNPSIFDSENSEEENPPTYSESRYDGPPFISIWNTNLVSDGSSESNQIKLPLIESGYYNFTINWGDGTIEDITSYNQPEITHTYLSSGEYTINISGDIRGFSFSNSGDRLKIINITQWGALRLGNTGGYFWGANNLEFRNTTDQLNTTGVTNMSSAFRETHSPNYFSPNFFNFTLDTSEVIDMSYIFSKGKFEHFNVSTWDTSKVIYLNNAFEGFDEGDYSTMPTGISFWNVSNVIDMSYAFYYSGGGYEYYTSEMFLKNWDVSNVRNMSYMFEFLSGDQYDFVLWNVSNVIDMSGMFRNVAGTEFHFNSWDVSNVKYMREMFAHTGSIYEYNFSDWDVKSVEDMSGIFMDSGFGANIDNWNVSNVKDMNNMFYGAYNFCSGVCNLSLWDVSNVKNMSGMFRDNGINDNLSYWNVSNVVDFSYMFYGAYMMNQYLEFLNWDLSSMKYAIIFFEFYNDPNILSLKYDSMLEYWSNLELEQNAVLDFGEDSYVYYCNSQAARDKIINDFNWTILNDELLEGCPK